MAELSVMGSSASAETVPEGIEVTEAAAVAIRRYLEEHGKGPDAGLRVGVRGGGCSGLSYFLDAEDAPRAGDQVIEVHGVKVFVDPKSLLFLRGTTLDYVKGLMESGFKFVNPKAGKGCGCGESFSPV